MKNSKIKKLIVPIIALLLAVTVICLGVFVGIPKCKRNKPIEISIDTAKEISTFDGFGVSACWWSQVAGGSDNAEEIAKLLFNKDEGLGLNIYRYNVGAGEKDNINSIINNPWRASESFYVWNEEKGEYEYDFTRDANAQKMLDLAVKNGVDTVVLFANSPHYSMTVSGKASGGDEQNVSNLPKENYKAYADYFLTITQYFLDKGIPVKYISPINEPQWGWGGGNASQEGCHYEPEEIYELFKVFAEEIENRKIDVLLSGPESGAICDETKEWFKTLYNDETIRKHLGTLAYHSYWSDDFVDRKADLGNWINENIPEGKVEMSEWCQLPCWSDTTSIFGALTEARVIANDIKYTNVNSWSVWTGINQNDIRDDGKNYSDGLLTADDNCSQYEKALRYYAVAHFSKFIPAGSVQIDTTKNADTMKTWNSDNPEDTELRNIDERSTVAFKTPDGKIVLVIVNEGDWRNFSFKVDGKENMTVYTTTESEQLANTYSGKIKKIQLPQWSITTVVFE